MLNQSQLLALIPFRDFITFSNGIFASFHATGIWVVQLFSTNAIAMKSKQIQYWGDSFIDAMMDMSWLCISDFVFSPLHASVRARAPVATHTIATDGISNWSEKLHASNAHNIQHRLFFSFVCVVV